MDATGGIPDGYDELTTKAAIASDWGSDTLEVTGSDRHRFVNGLATCDLRDLAAGDGRYGFLTTGKGRVLADAVIAALDDRFVLELPPGSGPPVRSHLERYRVADRVAVEEPPSAARTVVAGPAAAELLRSLVGEAPSGWGAASGPGWRLVGDRRLGVPAWRLDLSGPEGDELRAALAALRLPSAGREALTAVRVEHGVPWFGTDFDAESLPQETGLEETAVSYEKGCYLGQEVVARVHYRGRPSKRLSGLTAPPEQPLAAGAELFVAGEPVGRLTTAAYSPRLGRWAAFGVLQRKAEGAERVALADGGEVTVAELPLVLP